MFGHLGLRDIGSRVVAAVVVMGWLSSAAMAQTTWHVRAAGVGPGSGSVADPFLAIQDGINAAVNGDVVVVRPGTYFENIAFMGKDITVRSQSGAGATVIDGLGGFPCVSFINSETSAAVVRGFTLTNGAAIDGGGVLCVQSAPRIEDCVVVGNFGVNDGGGIHCFGGAPTITRCIIQGNTSGFQGGGISVVVGANATIRDSTISGNSSLFGGGVVVNNASATLIDCRIESNQATVDGGGIHLLGGSQTIRRCEIVGNTAGGDGGAIAKDLGNLVLEDSKLLQNDTLSSGGGMTASTATVSVRNTVIGANTAGAFGGGVFSTFSGVTLLSSTIRDNACAFGGGGVVVFAPPSLTVINSILWGNLPDQVGASPLSTPTLVTFSDVQGGFSGTGNFGLDPLHVAAAAFDYHLWPASPCIGAGSNAAIGGIVADFEGHPRRFGAVTDMGADEFVVPLVGSGEDLELDTSVNDLGGDVALHPAAVGDVLRIAMRSPFGTFDGAPPILAGQLFAVGAPPIGPPGFPTIHLSISGAQVLFDGASAGVFGPVLLGPAVPTLVSTVPPGLGGFAGRIQLLVVTPFAVNGFFAISDAHEFRFV